MTTGVLKLIVLSLALPAEPILYAPLDRDARAMLVPYAASTQSQGTFDLVDGAVGKAAQAEALPLDYDLAGLLTRHTTATPQTPATRQT